MILDEIIEAKREELAGVKHNMPLSKLEERIAAQSPPLDFASALCGEGVKLIAEVKKASPSRGLIRPDLDPVQLALTYADNGAAAISVLTERRYFQGSLELLATIKENLGERNIPILRKDFIFDPYQVYESHAYGADALLLIAAILSNEQLMSLVLLSHNLGMQCLVEVHDEAELEGALQTGARVIGINNRDLRTFSVDLTTTKRLRPLVPPDRIVVSESGIRNRADVQRLRGWGVDAILVGEALVTADDVAARMKEFL